MIHLRKMMLKELERRDYGETTKGCSIRVVEELARYFNRAQPAKMCREPADETLNEKCELG
jgi:uncharacterized protein YydD (DUF2326 family)